MDIVQVAGNCSINVRLYCSCQPTYLRPEPLLDNCLDRMSLTMRYDWKTGFYGIYSELIKLDGDLNLLLRCYRDARALLSISQGSVEYSDLLVRIVCWNLFLLLCLRPAGFDHLTMYHFLSGEPKLLFLQVALFHSAAHGF